MKRYSFYNVTTGKIHSAKFATDDSKSLELNTPKDHTAIEGDVDHMSKRMDITTGNLVEYKPDQPSTEHEWDDATKRWNLNKAAKDKMNARNRALSQILTLESQQPRIIRELFLHEDSGAHEKLQSIEDQIVELRKLL